MNNAHDSSPAAPRTPATRQEVVSVLGEIDDVSLAEILALRPTLEDVEAAAAWSMGESDVMGEARKPLSGVAGQIYEILSADEAFEDGRL